jgi:hypothetical protein
MIQIDIENGKHLRIPDGCTGILREPFGEQGAVRQAGQMIVERPQ